MMKMWSRFARKSRVSEGDINAKLYWKWVEVSKLHGEMFVSPLLLCDNFKSWSICLSQDAVDIDFPSFLKMGCKKWKKTQIILHLLLMFVVFSEYLML